MKLQRLFNRNLIHLSYYWLYGIFGWKRFFVIFCVWVKSAICSSNHLKTVHLTNLAKFFDLTICQVGLVSDMRIRFWLIFFKMYFHDISRTFFQNSIILITLWNMSSCNIANRNNHTVVVSMQLTPITFPFTYFSKEWNYPRLFNTIISN